ncbi:RrF2 family transcriptional regulator, partial [Komagataeibacter europaeus]
GQQGIVKLGKLSDRALRGCLGKSVNTCLWVVGLMPLSLRTDYAFRVLIHLACNPDSRVTVRNITELQGISHNHLVKVVQHLCHAGIVQGTRGGTGGIRLAVSARNINVGHIMRLMETEKESPGACHPSGNNQCILGNACQFRHLIVQAVDAFMAFSDGMSLLDLTSGSG